MEGGGRWRQMEEMGGGRWRRQMEETDGEVMEDTDGGAMEGGESCRDGGE